MNETAPNPIAALQALEKHLREQAEHGVERVHLSAQAIADLDRLRSAVAGATVNPATPSIAEEPPPRPQAQPKPTPPEPRAQTPPPAKQDAPAPPPAPESPPAGDADKRVRLRELAKRAKFCEATRALGTLRQDFVFATGNPDANLMFVGEAPGMEEEKKHRPFVGPAGQLLDKIINGMGLQREDVYISNIVKFRPSTGDANQGSSNRKPSAEEMSTSVKYVLEEIAIVEPKVIVALGGTAMEGLLGLEGSVGSQRSRFHTLRGVPVMVTYHPSDLLGRGEKRKVWEDLLLVMGQLGMPISPKQRSFFL